MLAPLLPVQQPLALFHTSALRQMEAAAQVQLPPGCLMARAGQAAARLLRARWPAARQVSVLCGPGNNGGDGLVMARHLHEWGMQVDVVLVGQSPTPPLDRQWAEQAARQAGVALRQGCTANAHADVVVDALLGIGLRNAPTGLISQALCHLSSHPAPRMALDIPSGLDAEEGRTWGAVPCDLTLSFLAAKPGLLTGAGRSLCGELWLDDLEVVGDQTPCAWATGSLAAWADWSPRVQDSAGAHKGRMGQVWVLVGPPSMGGAASLAGRAALAAGAGRVYLVGAPGPDLTQPELMAPTLERALAALSTGTAVVGCGGGPNLARPMRHWLEEALQLVLDADGLNAVAQQPDLAKLLVERAQKGLRTVITPHPLEAARLLGLGGAADVQASRLACAQALAQQFACCVVLKGSGTVIASPGAPPLINTTGHSALGTAGTGDVLAGWLAGLMAQAPQAPLQELAACACAWHGLAAHQRLAGSGPLLASNLVQAMADLHPHRRGRPAQGSA